MFHWPLIRYPHVAARLGLSFALLNILPVLFFAWVLFVLRNTQTEPINQWSAPQTLLQVLAGVVPAFAVFGFYRLWLAVVEFWPTRFYQCEGDQDDTTRRTEKSIECLNLLPEFAPWNFLFAVAYIVLAGGVPWLIVR